MKTRNMKVGLFVSAACVVVFAICGCRITRVCNSDGGMEISMLDGGQQVVRAVDTCFKDGLSVESKSLIRNKLGFLVASVMVRNLHGDPEDYDREDAFSFEYRFSWFDKYGMEIMPDSHSWIRKDVGGGAAESLSMTAPIKEATSVIIRFRHAK